MDELLRLGCERTKTQLRAVSEQDYPDTRFSFTEPQQLF